MPGASLVRYDEDPGTATVVGGWSADGRLRLPVGGTIDLDGDTVIARVLRSGTPERAEYAEATGALAETLQSAGYRGAVAAPVLVGGPAVGRARRRDPLARRRSPRAPSSASATSPSWSRRRSPTPTRTSSSPPPARASSRPATPSAAGSSATCTTARSSGSCRSRSTCAWSTRRCAKDPAAAGELLVHGAGPALPGARRAARARPRHPSRRAHRPRPGSGDRVAGASARRCRSRSPRCRTSASPGPVEAAAYYVVAEAMTNVAKYAQATHATVSVSR